MSISEETGVSEPEETARRNVTRLEYQGKELILIATAHVSRESAALVREVVTAEQPDSICVELDEDRLRNMQNPDAWKKTDIVQVIRSKKVGFLIANLILSSYQKKLAARLDTAVGQEMREGIACAEEFGKNLVLADRQIQTTFLRIWRKITFWEKLKLIFGLVFSLGDDTEVSAADVEEMLQEDMLDAALSDIRANLPKAGHILVDERDQYLAHQIKNAPGPKVVAILGAAHVAGIKNEIPLEQDIEAITALPPPHPLTKAIGWIIPILICGLIVFAFAQNMEHGLRQLTAWVLWNSALAGVFTAASLAHPLSVLTAFVLAPFTSINPFLACGWFAGLTEAALKKPTVEDVERVPEDIFTFKGFFRNRFLHILTVVVMANLGSSIGTFAAGFDILTNLFP
ncbi:MAG: TraB/GumN family protein [Gracilibacteraceae bacterium]|jgi:pheromone shutdown-related protein TraB|nr:TraB/GumN family protein [Gracilibacteraceae bacterium]